MSVTNNSMALLVLSGYINNNKRGWFECDLSTTATGNGPTATTATYCKRYTGSLGVWLRFQLRQLNSSPVNRPHKQFMTAGQSQILTQLVKEGNIDINRMFSNDSNNNDGDSSSSSSCVTDYSDPYTENDDDPAAATALSWHVHYTALLAYRKQYGHANVPLDTFYECSLRVSLPQSFSAATGVTDATGGVALSEAPPARSTEDSTASMTGASGSCNSANGTNDEESMALVQPIHGAAPPPDHHHHLPVNHPTLYIFNNSSESDTATATFANSSSTSTNTIYYANYLGRWLARQRRRLLRRHEQQGQQQHHSLLLPHNHHHQAAALLQQLVDQCKWTAAAITVTCLM